MSADKKSSISWRDLPLLALVVPLVLLLSLPFLFWIACRTVFYSFVLVAIWIRWLPHGKDTLVIYSDSPHWKEYFETEVNPTLSSRSYILNWSHRKQWNNFTLPTLAFHGFSGAREFNPLVIVFKKWKWPRRFRFFKAFHDLKHRNQATIYRVLNDLKNYIGQALPYPPLPPRSSA